MSIAQFWQTLRPIRRVGKSRGIIEVPAFTADCGPGAACFNFMGQENQGIASTYTLTMPNSVTLKLAIKPFNVDSTNDDLGLEILAIRTGAADDSVLVYLNIAGKLTVKFTTYNGGPGQVQTVESVDGAVTFFEWNVIDIVYDAAEELAAIWVNGTCVCFTNDVEFGLNPVPDLPLVGAQLAWDNATDWPSFYCGLLAIWDKGDLSTFKDATTLAERNISNNWNWFPAVSTDGDADIIAHWQFDEGTGTTIADIISGADFTVTPDPDGPHDWVTDDYVPLYYGASFIVGRFAIATSSPFSFKFPNTAPEDCDFGLVVSWLDDDNNRISYYLFLPEEGISVSPELVKYTGQKIPASGAYLEVWNIDGNRTVTLAAAYELLTSILHNATSYTSATETTDATLTIDTTLAENYPLQFPLTFNTQQTY